MTVESSLFIKFLWAPMVALLGWFFKDKIKTLEKDNEALQEKVSELETDIAKNYYDKNELKEHVDTQIRPLKQSMEEMTASVKALTGMVTDLHQDMAILKYKILGEELKNQ